LPIRPKSYTKISVAALSVRRNATVPQRDQSLSKASGPSLALEAALMGNR